MSKPREKTTLSGLVGFILILVGIGIAVAVGDWRIAVYTLLAAFVLTAIATHLRQRGQASPPREWPCPTCGLSPDDKPVRVVR